MVGLTRQTASQRRTITDLICSSEHSPSHTRLLPYKKNVIHDIAHRDVFKVRPIQVLKFTAFTTGCVCESVSLSVSVSVSSRLIEHLTPWPCLSPCENEVRTCTGSAHTSFKSSLGLIYRGFKACQASSTLPWVTPAIFVHSLSAGPAHIGCNYSAKNCDWKQVAQLHSVTSGCIRKSPHAQRPPGRIPSQPCMRSSGHPSLSPDESRTQ